MSLAGDSSFKLLDRFSEIAKDVIVDDDFFVFYTGLNTKSN